MKTPVLVFWLAVLSAVSASAELVAHWPLDTNSLDKTGNGHDGVEVGALTYGHPGANAKTGGSADFPGTAHFDVPYSAALNPGVQAPDGSGSFTVAFWAFATAAGGGEYRSPFTNREDNGVTSNGPMIYNNFEGVWSFWAGNNGPPGTWNDRNAGPVAVDAWTHVAITYDQATTTRRMLINGVEVISEVLGISPTVLRDMHFGAGADFGGAYYWDGRLDDIGVWDTALTDEEINAIMVNGIAADSPNDPNLLVPSPYPLALNGSVQTFDITLNNGGSTNPLTVTAASFTGTHATSFTLVSLPAAIAPGANGVIKVSFDPAGISGAVDAVMEVTSNSVINPVKLVTLSGFIHDPFVASATPRLEFGTFPVNSGPQMKTLTIRNDGAAQVLNISAITPNGPDAAAFTVGTFTGSIAPGASETVEITFDPLEADGSFLSRMSILTDDPLTPTLTVVLHAEVPVAKALVAWWPLNGDAVDATGSGFDGTVIGEETVIFGQAGASAVTGTSADFTSGGHIDVPFDPRLNPTSFTVTLWANADSIGSYASPLTSRVHGGGGETNGYLIYNTEGGLWSFWSGQGTVGWDDINGPAVQTGTWTHLAITYDATTDIKTLWVNGAAAAIDDTRNAPTLYTPNYSQALHIGAGDDTGMGFPFDGKIDDVALYKKALSQAEIQSIMTNGVSPPPASADYDITSLVLGPLAGQVTLTWESTATATYTVQRSATLSNWTDLTPNVLAVGPTTTYTDTTLPANTTKIYYRIKRLP